MSPDQAAPRLIGCAVFAALAWFFAAEHARASESLQVHCQGQGTPLYLVGGGPAFTTWNLKPVQDRLDDRYRVCRWDMRGVGDNASLPIDAGRSVLDQWLDDMAEVLPEQPVALWGHSWGALQVLAFAVRHPERVEELVLSNPVDPALSSLESIELKRFVHPQNDARLSLDDIGTSAEAAHNLRSKIASYFLDGDLGWDYATGFSGADSNAELNVRVWDDYRRAPVQEAEVRRLGEKIRGVLYCAQDVLQPESLDAYRRLLTDTRHLLLEGCGHFPWVEQPDRYALLLRTLLSGDR